METHRRSLTKALSWRLFALLITCLVALVVTGSAATSLAIGGADFLIKIGTYYLHERLWLNISWGRVDSSVVDDGAGV
jgi:uncharacterized membrane protein